MAHKLQVRVNLEAPTLFLAIEVLQYREEGKDGTLETIVLAGISRPDPKQRFFGGGANQSVFQPYFDTPFGKQFVSEKGETLGHLGQNSVARMNEYATCLFVSKPREVPPHAVDKVAQFSNNFDAGESSTRHHERQQLAAQLSISFNLRLFQRRESGDCADSMHRQACGMVSHAPPFPASRRNG